MSNPILQKSYVAGSAISPFRLVKLGADDVTVLPSAAATDLLIGVCNEVGPALGERCDLVMVGIAFVEAGAAITRGSAMTSDASGRGIATTTAGNAVIGRALEAAAAAGDIIRVLLAPGNY
jgi:hypothetical protein